MGAQPQGNPSSRLDPLARKTEMLTKDLKKRLEGELQFCTANLDRLDAQIEALETLLQIDQLEFDATCPQRRLFS